MTLCPFTFGDAEDLLKYGNYFSVKCQVQAENKMLNEPQFFYELYVRSTKDSFIDVPVAISGYLDKGSNRLNQDPLDTGKLVFVRRFTLVDTLSGIENAEGETVSTLTSKNPKYIRYISKATFYIKPTSTGDHRILKPYLFIEYTEKKAGTVTTEGSDIEIGVMKCWLTQTKYQTEISTFWRTCIGLFIAANVLVVLIVIGKMYIW